MKKKPLWIYKYSLKQRFFPHLINSNEYCRYLRYKDISIGKGTHFFYPPTTTIDIQRPWLLSIGEYCKITSGVIILTHDYSRSVLRRVYGSVIGEAEKTTIGNNVFIGMNSIILMGATIGDNVIIGAGSVVKGNIPSNSVVAGCPARVLCSLDEYYQNRKEKTINEAKLYAKSFYEKKGRYPTIKEMGPFYQLFLERSKDLILKEQIFTKLSGDNEEELIDDFLKLSPPIFKSYNEFIKHLK